MQETSTKSQPASILAWIFPNLRGEELSGGLVEEDHFQTSQKFTSLPGFEGYLRYRAVVPETQSGKPPRVTFGICFLYIQGLYLDQAPTHIPVVIG
jgi:hypothetical protein